MLVVLSLVLISTVGSRQNRDTSGKNLESVCRIDSSDDCNGNHDIQSEINLQSTDSKGRSARFLISMVIAKREIVASARQ